MQQFNALQRHHIFQEAGNTIGKRRRIQPAVVAGLTCGRIQKLGGSLDRHICYTLDRLNLFQLNVFVLVVRLVLTVANCSCFSLSTLFYLTTRCWANWQNGIQILYYAQGFLTLPCVAHQLLRKQVFFPSSANPVIFSHAFFAFDNRLNAASQPNRVYTRKQQQQQT
jgi:hypothetical protein